MSEWGPFSDGVTLSLEAPAQVSAPGAPVVLTARLMNYGGGPVAFVVRSVWIDYDVHVTREGEGELAPLPAAVQRREAGLEGRRLMRQIQHREKLAEEIPLHEWFDLSHPGRYHVVASRGFRKLEPEPARDVTVRSNELVLEVQHDAGHDGGDPQTPGSHP
jgi:hypothetical protein